MSDEDLNKQIEALRANRLRLQELRKTTEERLEALTIRMDQIKAEMARRKAPTNGKFERE